MSYINTYEVTREFSGHEEGGNYHTVWTPLASVRIRGGINSPRALAAFNRYCKANGHEDKGYWAKRASGYYRSNDQIDHTLVVIEPHRAKEWNNWQPYS